MKAYQRIVTTKTKVGNYISALQSSEKQMSNCLAANYPVVGFHVTGLKAL